MNTQEEKTQGLTAKQYQYLLYLWKYEDIKGQQSAIADFFGINKVTVFQTLSLLESKGMVKKNRYSQIRLTKLGRETIGPMSCDFEELALWMTECYGIRQTDAELDAIRMVCAVSRCTVNRIVNTLILARCVQEHSSSEGVLRNIRDGRYVLPFKVFRKDGKTLSMGDRGFQKPLLLVKEGNVAVIEFLSCKIRHTGALGNLLSGQLARLWYAEEGVWHEVAQKDRRWVLPARAMKFIQSGTAVEGRIRIRVQASCGVVNMPESEAVVHVGIRQNAENFSTVQSMVSGS